MRHFLRRAIPLEVMQIFSHDPRGHADHVSGQRVNTPPLTRFCRVPQMRRVLWREGWLDDGGDRECKQLKGPRCKICWGCLSAAADVNGDMNNFFNKLVRVQYQPAVQVRRGRQRATLGGSLYARTQVKTIQLVKHDLPVLTLAAAASMYLGLSSFINSEQLQRFGKQIMSNAAGYFFDLALQTTVPETNCQHFREDGQRTLTA